MMQWQISEREPLENNMRRATPCSLAILLAVTLPAVADDWPQWRGPTRDGVWRETGLLEKFPSERMEPKWRVPIGPGYSGPTVADGRVFVTDRQAAPKEIERVVCFDEKTGKPLWTYSYECPYGKISYTAGPRACVTIADGRAYALGAAGHLHCLAVEDGKVLWMHDCNQEYRIEMPNWGITAAPLIVDDLVIVHIGGEGACVVAFDKTTGSERWKALNDRGQYSAPILIEQAGKRVVVVWTGDNVAGLDPASGEVYWKFPFKPRNMPIGVASPVSDGERLFFTSFYDGSLLLKLTQDKPGVEKLWHRVGPSEKDTDALQSIISTPIILGDAIYGVDSHGELRCLDEKTGDRVWEDLSATPKIRWGTIHFVKNGDRVWMFNEVGELIIAKLSRAGYQPISKTKILDPTTDQLPRRDGVCWSHPAFANKCVFARNDKELVCVDLSAR